MQIEINLTNPQRVHDMPIALIDELINLIESNWHGIVEKSDMSPFLNALYSERDRQNKSA